MMFLFEHSWVLVEQALDRKLYCSCVESCTDVVRSGGEAECTAPNAKRLVHGYALL